MDDNSLINNIKKEKNTDESLQSLVNKHSGIFYDMINRFVPADSKVCSKEDMMRDRDLLIYNSALKFDPSKGTKFSTFLGNETKWMCLNSYNKEIRKKCETIPPEEIDFLDKIDFNDNIDLNLLNEIYFIIDKHPDLRVSKIFKMRYKEGEKSKCMAWKHIGKAVGLSIQGCINIHDNVVNELKNKILKKEIK